MADSYTNWGRHCLATADGEPSGQIDWVLDDIRVVLINASRYAFDLTHRYLSHIPENARIAILEIADRTCSDSGACGAADTEVAHQSGDPVGALGLIKYVEDDPEASVFFFWIDSYSNIPAFLTGGKFTIRWPKDAGKIFRI